MNELMFHKQALGVKGMSERSELTPCRIYCLGGVRFHATFLSILGAKNPRSYGVPNFLGGGAQYPRIFGMGMPNIL